MKIIYKLITDFIILAAVLIGIGYVSYIGEAEIMRDINLVNKSILPAVGSLRDMKIATLRVLSSTMELAILADNTGTAGDDTGSSGISAENNLRREGIELFARKFGKYAKATQEFGDPEASKDEIMDKWNIFLSESDRFLAAVASGADKREILDAKEDFEKAEMELSDVFNAAIAGKEKKINGWGADIERRVKKDLQKISGAVMVFMLLILLSIYRAVRGVREKSETESRLAMMNEMWISTFNAMDDGGAMLTLDNKIINANKSFCRLVGGRIEDLQGKDLYELFLSLGALIGESLERNKGKAVYVFAKNKKTWFSIIMSSVQGKDNRIKHNLIILRNITEEKKIEQNLADRNEELEKFRLLTVDREMKMIELKEKIKELEEGAVPHDMAG